MKIQVLAAVALFFQTVVVLPCSATEQQQLQQKSFWKVVALLEDGKRIELPAQGRADETLLRKILAEENTPAIVYLTRNNS